MKTLQEALKEIANLKEQLQAEYKRAGNLISNANLISNNRDKQLSDKDKEIKELTAELKEMAFAGIEPVLLDKPINIPATQKNKELRLALADKDKEIAKLVRDIRAILQRSEEYSAAWIIATDALKKYPAP